MNDYGTLPEAIAKWNAGDTVWTIEMGGLGPGYEQAIQVGIFELAKRLDPAALPPEDDQKALWDALDAHLHAAIKEVSPVLDGLSGAQAGAIMSVAYRFVKKGYNETIQTVPKDRLIQASKSFPSIAVA